MDGAFKHNLDPMGRIFERANIQEFKCPVYCRRGRERDVEASNLSMCYVCTPKESFAFLK